MGYIFKAKANFSYEAQEPDELSFAEGDVLHVTSKKEDEGWWEAELKGKVGMFPSSFVEILPEDPPAKSSAARISDLALPAMVPPTALRSSSKRIRAKVLFNYTAENPDELDLQVGDIIHVTKQEDEGWWEGELNSKHGMFPSNFVEEIASSSSPQEDVVIKPKKVLPQQGGIGSLFQGGIPNLKRSSQKDLRSEDSPLTAAKSQNPHHSIGLVHSTTSTPPIPASSTLTAHSTFPRRHKCIFSYTAEHADELSIKAGDIITVTGAQNEDWWEGESKGLSGLFPSNFVDSAPEISASFVEPKRPAPVVPTKSADSRPSSFSASASPPPSSPLTGEKGDKRDSCGPSNKTAKPFAPITPLPSSTGTQLLGPTEELAAKFANLKSSSATPPILRPTLVSSKPSTTPITPSNPCLDPLLVAPSSPAQNQNQNQNEGVLKSLSLSAKNLNEDVTASSSDSTDSKQISSSKKIPPPAKPKPRPSSSFAPPSSSGLIRSGPKTPSASSTASSIGKSVAVGSQSGESDPPKLGHATLDRPKKNNCRLPSQFANITTEKDSIHVSDDLKDEIRNILFELNQVKIDFKKQIQDLRKEFLSQNLAAQKSESIQKNL